MALTNSNGSAPDQDLMIPSCSCSVLPVSTCTIFLSLLSSRFIALHTSSMGHTEQQSSAA
jgi:hypothetical protein